MYVLIYFQLQHGSDAVYPVIVVLFVYCNYDLLEQTHPAHKNHLLTPEMIIIARNA